MAVTERIMVAVLVAADRGLLLILVMVYYLEGFAVFFKTTFRETKNKTMGDFLNGAGTAAF
jgi:hypothetical protein